MGGWSELSTGAVEDTEQIEPADEIEPGHELDGRSPVHERLVVNDLEGGKLGRLLQRQSTPDP